MMVCGQTTVTSQSCGKLWYYLIFAPAEAKSAEQLDFLMTNETQGKKGGLAIFSRIYINLY